MIETIVLIAELFSSLSCAGFPLWYEMQFFVCCSVNNTNYVILTGPRSFWLLATVARITIIAKRCRYSLFKIELE